MTTTVTINFELPSEKTYKIGDFFVLYFASVSHPELFILANTYYSSVSLISVETGERLLNPISVEHYGKITQDEINQMVPFGSIVTHVDKVHLVKNI
jgi:hypothetical protein